MLDLKHLTKAREYSKLPASRWFYFKHMFWAFGLSLLLFTWSLLMVVHAVFPQLVGFFVIESLIKLLKKLKYQHPEDPLLKTIDFN